MSSSGRFALLDVRLFADQPLREQLLQLRPDDHGAVRVIVARGVEVILVVILRLVEGLERHTKGLERGPSSSVIVSHYNGDFR